MSEYVTRFTQLSRYAPEDVDTDEKKQDCFLEGLNDGLQYSLASHDFKNFQSLVDRALILEHKRNNIERRRKMDCPGQLGGNTRPRYDTSQSVPMNRSDQQYNQPRAQSTNQSSFRNEG